MAALVVAFGLAAAYLSFTPRLYTSTAKVLVQQNGPRLLTANTDDQAGRSDGYLYQQVEIIRAEPILAQAAEACLEETIELFPFSRNRIVDLQNKLTVGIGKRDEVISVSLESERPEAAARLVNAVVAAYESFQSQSVQSSAAEALKILRREKDKQDAVLGDKLKEIVAFKQENSELFFTNDHGTNILMQNLATVADQATKARLVADQLHASVDAPGNRMQKNATADLAERQAVALEAAYDREKAKASKVNAAEAAYQKLQVEADRTAKLCDALDARIKELDVSAYSGAMNIRILERARPEVSPTWPKKSTVLLAAMVAGLTLGGGLAVTREWLDRRFHSPEQVARLLGLPVLAAVPDVDTGGPAGPAGLVGPLLSPGADEAFAEAYHGLAATLWFADGARSTRSVLVAGPERRDGASVTCANLALAAASAGRRTLVIDANVRRPSQHELHGVPNAVGLSDLIARGVRAEQAIRPAAEANLWILPAGAAVARPGEVAHSQAFGELLQRLEADYDLIVIDGPAILASAEARLFGAQADLTLLVLNAPRSTEQAARAACERLRGVGADVVGVVLNHAVASRRRRASAAPAVRPAWQLLSGRPGDERGAGSIGEGSQALL